MKSVRLLLICSALTTAVFWLGCGNKATPPPKVLALEQAPKSLEDAFKKAGPQAKQLADDTIAALNAKDFARALLALQSLSGRSDLSLEQREMAAGAMLAVNKALEEQAGSGSQDAQKALDFRRSTK